MGFLVKKYTCPVIFLGCPGRPGLVFVGPCIVETDTQGRYLFAKLSIEKTEFFLINIYAPNDYREQEQFIKMLS